MRTTVTIDDDLLASAKVLAARTHRPIGTVMEEALRKLLAEHTAYPTEVIRPDFSYEGGLRDGVDLDEGAATARLLGESNRWAGRYVHAFVRTAAG